MAITRTSEHKLETKSISKEKHHSSFKIHHFASGRLNIALFPFLDNNSLATLSATSKTLTKISTDTLEARASRVLEQLVIFLKSPDVVGKSYIIRNKTSYGFGPDKIVLRTWEESIRFPTKEEIEGILNTKKTQAKKLNTLFQLISVPLQFYLFDLKNHLPKLPEIYQHDRVFSVANIESIPPSINHLLQTRAMFHRLGIAIGERFGRSVIETLLDPVKKLLDETFSFHIWNHDYTKDPQPLFKELQIRGLSLEKSLLQQLIRRFCDSIRFLVYSSHPDLDKYVNTSILKLESILKFLVKLKMPIESPSPDGFETAIHLILTYTSQLIKDLWIFRLIDLVLNLGANFNAVDYEGNTAFLIAVSLRNEETAIQMLERYKDYIDINAVNNKKQTAVMIAANRGHVILLEKLITAGADVTLKDINLHDAYTIAANALFKKDAHEQILQLLVAATPISNKGDEWEMVSPLYSPR